MNETTNYALKKPLTTENYDVTIQNQNMDAIDVALKANADAIATKETPAGAQAKIDAAIAALLSGAPGALDTLNELAAAMGDDANFAATITNALAAKANKAVVDAHLAEKATEAALGHVIIGTGLDVTAGGVVSVETDTAKFKKGSSTYTDNDTAQTFTDAFCTANSLVTIVITSVTLPQGVWSVESGVGSFTITSTKAESADITFDYYIQKVVA